MDEITIENSKGEEKFKLGEKDIAIVDGKEIPLEKLYKEEEKAGDEVEHGQDDAE